MFVYSGKLTWRSSAKNETFVIILPNGAVRTGDSVYLFSQWTKDSDGVEKKNWFENLPVGKVSKNSSGEDTFTVTSSWFNFVITVQKAYGNLSVNMSHHHWYPSFFSETIKFERVWQPVEHHPTGSTRIWTGKIQWRDFAKNELAMFILPDGVGEGKPVLSIWQWTKSSAKIEKDFQFRNATQKVLAGTDNEVVKFSFNSYYDINCSWNQKTEKLAVNMKEGGHSENIGTMSLAVLIDRHTHHFGPPRRASVEKKELEVRLPQAQSSLPRITTPLPFPDDIVQSLAQSVAFADHAGYLAKYAQDRFNALDADFHARGQQLDTLKTQNSRHEQTIKDLGGKLHAGEAKAENLDKQLAAAKEEAKRKETDLTNQIRALQDNVNHSAEHVKKDHDVIQKTREALDNEKANCVKLSEELQKAKVNNTVIQAQLKTARDDHIKLDGEYHALDTQYHVEKKHCQELDTENHKLKKENHDLADRLAAMQLKLEASDKLYHKSQNDLKTKNDILVKEQAKVTQLEKERSALTTRLDAAAKARDVAKTEAAKNLSRYDAEVKLTKEWESKAVKNLGLYNDEVKHTKEWKAKAETEAKHTTEWKAKAENYLGKYEETQRDLDAERGTSVEDMSKKDTDFEDYRKQRDDELAAYKKKKEHEIQDLRKENETQEEEINKLKDENEEDLKKLRTTLQEQFNKERDDEKAKDKREREEERVKDKRKNDEYTKDMRAQEEEHDKYRTQKEDELAKKRNQLTAKDTEIKQLKGFMDKYQLLLQEHKIKYTDYAAAKKVATA